MSTRGGGAGRRGGRGEQGGGRGGGSGGAGGGGGGRGRGQQGAAELGGPGRGDRGGASAPGAAQRGGHAQSPHPAGAAAGRGGHSGVPQQGQGRGQQQVTAPAPTPAEVEAMRRQLEKKVVVGQAPAQAQAGPRQGSSSQAPAPGQAPQAAPRPAMQGRAPVVGQVAPAGRGTGTPVSSFPAQSPAAASFQAPAGAVRPGMPVRPPGQVAPAASQSSSFPALQGQAPVRGPTPGRPAMPQVRPPGQFAPAANPSSSFPGLQAPVQRPAPGRPAMQAVRPPGQFAPAASPSSVPAPVHQGPAPGRPAMQVRPPGQSAPVQGPSMQVRPPVQVAPAAARPSSSLPAPVQGAATPGRPSMQVRPPVQVAPAASPPSSSLPAPVQGPAAPGRPAMQVRPPGQVQVAPAAGISSSGPQQQMQGKAPGQVAPPLSAPAGTLPPVSSKAMAFPARPGYGTVGRRCRVRANHVQVQLADKDIYHYDVAITPESASRARNRWIINELVNVYKQHLDGRLPVYDGRKSLFTAGPLPFKSKEFVLNLTNPERANQGDKEYKVAIKDAAKLDMYSLKMFLASRSRDMPQNTIQALDIALREFPTAKYTPISKSFFSPHAFGNRGPLGNGVECWRGYYQSLRPTQMGLSLNIDVSATSFFKAQPVINFALEYLNLRDTSKRLSDQDRIKLKKALKGVRVATTHRQDISIRYRITGITSAPLNDLTFDQNGTRVSVVQYFKRQYNYSLKYTHWPCLQAGSASNKQMYLPIEVCSIVEGQRYTSKLNENQVRNILKLACERPAERESRTFEVFSKNNSDSYAKEFGLKVMNELTLVDARVLPAPRLKYHDSGRERVCNPSVGQWNMINKRMVNGGSIKYWACITFASRLHPNDIGMFCEDLVGMCNNIGMQMSTRPCVEIKKAHQDNLESEIRGIHLRSAQVLAQQGLTEQQLELLIIILPDMSGYYGMIKRLCETELGLITQCCAPNNVRKGGKQFLENLSLKINVKVGGSNTVLEDAFNRRIPLVTDCPTIIFGADVTHPSPGESSSPSIAAVVASMDWPQVSKYKCLVSSQGHRVEIINGLYTEVRDPQKGTVVRGGMIRDLLVSFHKSTGYKPSRIIFYRDGVSEGQFSQVLLYEMDAIRKACASLQEGYLPKVTFVVVQKRHHTRLFPENHRARDQTDRSGNILPGTVVDTKICHPSEFDFYLCSHSGIQGTSRPAHYHVLMDENGFTADALQTLTYNLCYTYARCTRSVSIVPPAYYAHLGAFRARYYIEDDNSDRASSTGATRTFDQSVPVKQLPKIKEYVQRFMFYC